MANKTDWWNPFDGDVIPGINVNNAKKQLQSYVGRAPQKDYDIFEGLTVSGRPKQHSVFGIGARPAAEGGKVAGTTIQDPGALTDTALPASRISSITGASGTGTEPKVLDQAQIDSIMSMLSTYDATRDTKRTKARLKREEAEATKRREFENEEGKYKGKKVSTLQDFAGAKTDTDLNTRNTLENLISSLSTMGLGGARALTRQILDAANMSNRKANATQAQNNQGLDSAFNEFKAGNQDDIKKIADQHDYDVAEAEREWAQNRQNALYKKADVYNAADRTAEREATMKEGDSLNDVISKAAFLNPQYTGASRAMATPELGDYTQDIAQYNTAGIGANGAPNPAGAGATAPGNLAVKAIALNERDLGVKKKTEGDLGLGV